MIIETVIQKFSFLKSETDCHTMTLADQHTASLERGVDWLESGQRLAPGGGGGGQQLVLLYTTYTYGHSSNNESIVD